MLSDAGVRYRGALVNKSHVHTVRHVDELFDDHSYAVLRGIEDEYGRQVLSIDYTKLRSFISSARSMASAVAAPNKIKEVPRTHTHAHARQSAPPLPCPRFSKTKTGGWGAESKGGLLSPGGIRLRAGDVADHAAGPRQRR